MNKVPYFILIIFFYTSCFKEDEIIEPVPIDLTVGRVEMTENYKYQVFFDLGTDSSISQNLITDWDLGFECSDSGWHIILNSSKMMTAGNTKSVDFESVNSEEDIGMVFDHSSYFTDSTAIGKWYSDSETPKSFGHVYIINRGSDEAGNPLGIIKVVFDIQPDGSYFARYADINGNNENTVVIFKNQDKNFTCFSFDNGIVDIEPDKDSWDLLFTKYSTTLLDDNGTPIPYVLTGVLLNAYNVRANLISKSLFNGITVRDVWSVDLTKQKDVIGYDWKILQSRENVRYNMDTTKFYIIKDNAEDYYKLRFTDFHKKTGEKGYPTFEYLRL